MRITETYLTGAFIIEPKLIEDNRGFFTRTWCQKEFSKNGLNTEFVQCNLAYNKKSGTLRGMHFQEKPFEEIKLVRCTRGGFFDVIIDLRKDSDTFKQWFGVFLTEQNRRMLYIPKGFAHGYQTIKDHTEIFYQVSEFYTPAAESGVRWDDPAFNIEWPLQKPLVSLKDRGFAYFE